VRSSLADFAWAMVVVGLALYAVGLLLEWLST
jgi:hypothetical protein